MLLLRLLRGGGQVWLEIVGQWGTLGTQAGSRCTRWEGGIQLLWPLADLGVGEPQNCSCPAPAIDYRGQLCGSQAQLGTVTVVGMLLLPAPTHCSCQGSPDCEKQILEGGTCSLLWLCLAVSTSTQLLFVARSWNRARVALGPPLCLDQPQTGAMHPLGSIPDQHLSYGSRGHYPLIQDLRLRLATPFFYFHDDWRSGECCRLFSRVKLSAS